MAVTDPKVSTSAGFALERLSVAKASIANSQSAVCIARFLVPYGFEVARVHAWAGAVTATATIDVLLGTGSGTSVLTAALVPGAGTAEPSVGALVASRAGRRGKKDTSVQVRVTTNGSGAFTDLVVGVWIRPYPANGES